MSRGRVRVESHHKRIRAVLGDQVVIDQAHPLLVWEVPYFPVYHFPGEAFEPGVLTETGATRRSPSRGEALVFDVAAGGKLAPAAAYGYVDSPIPELRGTVALKWKAMDHWFEEDEEVYVHARDPYTRIDILPSSRPVRVVIGGETVAESNNPRILHESGLPPRYYLPKSDVRFDLLTPTSTSTACPYKGVARYWTVSVNGDAHDDVVWGYDEPLPESAGIAGYVAFYNEKVDIYVDGVLQDRPSTKFS